MLSHHWCGSLMTKNKLVNKKYTGKFLKKIRIHWLVYLERDKDNGLNEFLAERYIDWSHIMKIHVKGMDSTILTSETIHKNNEYKLFIKKIFENLEITLSLEEYHHNDRL